MAPTSQVIALTSLVSKPPPGSINIGLKAVTPKTMTALLGNPRGDYTTSCQPVTNPALKRLIVTQNVGPFRVTGYQPAVRSLARVFADIAAGAPEVYPHLGSAGMLCCRLVRGSKTAISNHSWGTAIDLTLDKHLDKRGDNLIQYGMTLIAPFFNRHKWYWGAAFRVEDSMHFEASEALIKEWAKGA